jgi:hypothetical protein
MAVTYSNRTVTEVEEFGLYQRDVIHKINISEVTQSVMAARVISTTNG